MYELFDDYGSENTSLEPKLDVCLVDMHARKSRMVLNLGQAKAYKIVIAWLKHIKSRVALEHIHSFS